MAEEKKYSVTIDGPRSTRETGPMTLEELIEYFSYTLEAGASYSHEKGNSKIDTKPKTIRSLISNLNNAETNRAANGCPSTTYSL